MDFVAEKRTLPKGEELEQVPSAFGGQGGDRPVR